MALFLRWYRRLLAALPSTFREEYAEEMTGLLADLLRGQSRWRQLRVFTGAIADLAVAVPTEHRAALTAPQPVPATGEPSGAGRGAPVRRPRPRQSRRGFLRGAMAMAAAALGTGTAASVVAYLWPATGGGFGSIVDIGEAGEVRAAVATEQSLAVPSARAYVVAYDPADDPEGRYADLTGGSGMLALYQKCVHLGCRVPWCGQSDWFECPCHGSKYNRWGEFQSGPAPRGLDRFAVEVRDGRVLVDTRTVVTGPSRAIDTLGELPSGPHCGV